MKNTIKYLSYSLLTVGLLACESLVEDLNDDPNNPSDAPAELVFTGLQLANATTHEGLTARLAAMWTGQMKGVDRQWGDFQEYNVGGSNFTNMWDNIYYGTLRNSRIVLDKAEDAGAAGAGGDDQGDAGALHRQRYRFVGRYSVLAGGAD